MSEQRGEEAADLVGHDIRKVAGSGDDFERVWQMWHTVFPEWPIERERMQKLLGLKSGCHYMNDNGFCLAFLADESHGKIAAVGVLPEHRNKGLGTALLEKAQEGLKEAAREVGGEIKVFEIGSLTPRFWLRMPKHFPQEVKDFFIHRGFKETTEPIARDLYKDLGGAIASSETLDRVSKTEFQFVPWSPELAEECIAKQEANFTWSMAYKVLAATNQHNQVLVAIDLKTNAQVAWTLMCDPEAIVCQAFAFQPLMPSGPKTGLIAAVGVDPAYRSQGIGLALVLKAMENLRERGVEGVYIDSVVIQGFYEKLGCVTRWEFEGYARAVDE